MKYSVYRFVNSNGEILYIGKSKSLESRIRTHFQRGHLEDKCYKETKKVEYVTFETQIEMDIYEIYFINKWKPLFNTKNKVEDEHFHLQDKTFEWKELSFEKEFQKRKTSEKVDMTQVLKLHEKLIKYTKIVMEHSDDPQKESERIIKLLNEVGIEIFNERLHK